MTKQLRANSQRVQRSAARAALVVRPAMAVTSSDTLDARALGFGTDVTTGAWNPKPSMPTAICIHGKYHTRRLQEVPT